MRWQQCALVGALSLCAQVATAADQGFYFGLMAGQASYDVKEAPLLPPDAFPLVEPRLNLPLAPFPAFSVITDAQLGALSTSFIPVLVTPIDDDSATAWGALVGYRAARHVAVELSYLNLGTLKDSDTLVFGGGSTTYRRELETSGPALSVLGILPVTDRWEVYARAGVLFADLKLSTSSSGTFGGFSRSTTYGSEDVLWGAGTQFHWGEHWSVRLDFQRFEGVGSDAPIEADIDLVSLGVLYRL